MNNPHTALIEEKVAELIEKVKSINSECAFEAEEKFAYQQGFQDAIAMFYIDLTGTPKTKGTMQATIDTVLKEDRIRLHKLIEKEAEETSAEMLKEVLRQNGLPEGGHALMNTDMMHHIVIGCVGNLSTRLNKGLDKTPPNKV